MESFVPQLEQEARCSLCNDRFSEPKLLKCFHTFCKACIKRHTELNEEGNTFKCPECCTETSFPELKNVDELNPSVLHTRILKVLAFVESEKVCSVSENHSSATWYCFDCILSLCDECQTNHLLFTNIHNHKVISLTNLKKEELEFMLSREDNCRSHTGFKLDFFCQDCDIFICLECLKVDHSEHETILNEKKASKIRESLDDQLNKIDLREQELSSHVKVLEDIAVETKDQGHKAIEEIKEKAKKIIERVQQSEQELIEEIEKQIDNSNNEKTKGRNLLDKTKSARRFVSQVIERNLPSSHMRNIKDLARETIDSSLGKSVGYVNTRVLFVPSEECTGIMKAGLGKLTREGSSRVFHETDDDRDGFLIPESTIEINSEEKNKGRELSIENLLDVGIKKEDSGAASDTAVVDGPTFRRKPKRKHRIKKKEKEEKLRECPHNPYSVDAKVISWFGSAWGQ